MDSDADLAIKDSLLQWTERQTRAMGWDGWASAPRWSALRVEASHRRFYRIHPAGRAGDGAPESLVVMDSPPDLENNQQFERLAEVFSRHGVGVPRIFAREPAAGYFLLSDLGSRHLADVYRQPGPDAVLPATLNTLHRIQQIRDPAIPGYTAQRFRDELDIFARWFVEAFLQQTFPEDRLGPCFEALVANTQEQVQCCVHRDFHCRNLLLTDAGKIGVVDFQDALVGPAAYDLASLLRDCYYRFTEPEVARWRETYLAKTRLPVDRRRFAGQLDLTAVQRQLKAVGIFARLHLRDGKSSHLDTIMPVLGQLTDLCAAWAELAELGAFLHEVSPIARRRLEELSCAP